MKKLLLVLGSIGLWGLSAMAAETNLHLEVQRESQEVLKIQLSDREPVSNACDFYLKSLDYLPAIQTLVLNVERNFCAIDLYGQGRGEVKWTLPNGLRGFQDLKLIVNDRSRGIIELTPETATWTEE